ncbi:MAG TPA: hypothetical protein VIK93_03300, partial [Limnochordales bacterium]
MTREEIMRLEGRELDAAVAERVFGHDVVWVIEDRAKLVRRLPDGQCVLVPQYHDNIAAAWQVVERMTMMGYQFELSFVQGAEYESAPWLAIFCKPPRRVGAVHTAFGSTATEAICRAALRAMEEAER